MSAPPVTSTSRLLKDPLELQARRDARARLAVIQLLEHPANRYDILDRVARGESLQAIAEYFGVQYRFFHSTLTQRYVEELKAARAARAEALQERNLAVADRVESGHVEPGAARVATSIRNFYSERTAPEQWAPTSSVDLNVKGTLLLHWEALQQVMGETLDGEADMALRDVEAAALDSEEVTAEAGTDIEDADFAPVAPESAPETPPNVDDHPLL